jgi:ribonuclease P protein subunit RPR2
MRLKRQIADLAVERIERLFELAEVAAKAGQEQRSDRYTQLARAIGMRYRVRIPQRLKMQLCKRCHRLLIPGKTARVRLRGEYMTTTCLRCGEQMRRPYKTPRATSSRRAGIEQRQECTNNR